MNSNKIKFIFFGTGFFAEDVLKNLLLENIKPEIIITSPDKPTGRHQIITDGPIKRIAKENNIHCLQPISLKSEDFLNQFEKLIDEDILCVVCDYGKILPKTLLDKKVKDFINIHPSLLPEFRGPSPLQNTILQNKNNTGVTIIKMDEQMDHGPIIKQKQIHIDEQIWPISTSELANILAKDSANLLIETFKDYQNNNQKYTEQDHNKATYTKMIEKQDAQVFPDTESINDIYIKYQAYKHWPEIYYINKENKRVKIKKMSPKNIERVTEEGKKETNFKGF